MGAAAKFLTPNQQAGSRARLFSIPEFISSSFIGALMELAIPENWEPSGDATVDECVQAAIQAIESDKSMIGTILCTIGPIPSYGLPMDGQTYSRFDYQELWGLLPEGMKDELTFTLPDLRNVFVMGGDVPGLVGGEAEHTLTIDEIPPHNHGDHVHLPVQASGELPTSVPDIPIPDLFANRGGGLPHNNLPPYFTVIYYIIAV